MQSIQPKKRWRKLLFILLEVMVAYLLICTYLAYQYIHPSRTPVNTPSWVRDVQIPGAEGPNPTWVSPRLANHKGGPVVFVLAYGYGGTRLSFADLMRELPKQGFECVTPCMPGQDASPGKSVGFGYPEATVIVDTVRWVRSQYKKSPKIILYGVSMGGAASWLASEKDPTVDAVITEGAYAQFDQAMNNWLDRKFPGSSFYLQPMVWIASAMDHINPSQIVPANAAKKWRKPALVIQGGADILIPVSHADRIANGAHCPIWIVPNAEHAQCYEVAKTEYLKRLKAIADRL